MHDWPNKNLHKKFKTLERTKYAYIEEVEQNQQNVKLIKDIVDGEKIRNNEILFSAAEDIPIFFKVMILSNHDMLAECNNGFKRRYNKVTLTNKFLEGNEYELKKHEKGVYLRDNNLLTEFKTNNKYKLAYFHIIAPFATCWFTEGLKLPVEWVNEAASS